MADRTERLAAVLRPMRRAAVAWSGGVDSTFLLHAATEVLGPENVLAVTAVSATYPRAERAAAAALAKRMGLRRRAILRTAELENPRFTANPPDRCYHCKMELFEAMARRAAAAGFPALLDGSTLDDLADVRPGERARKRFGVRSPLREAGLGKADVRRLSRKAGLPTWNKPSLACLASRVPYGRPITARLLRRIERAEERLSAMGFSPLRVRDHDTIARIEVAPRQFAAALLRREEIAAALLPLGYRYAALDLAGFRSGSMNEPLRRARRGRRDSR